MTSPVDQPERLPPGKLGAYAAQIFEGHDLPVFSQHLLELLALPVDEPTAARRLFELTSQDYSLTCKVLRMANSFRYNRSSTEIESLSHAVVVLGVGTVQNLASTLVCFRSAEKRPESLRQLMIRSMVSAHVAFVTAELGAFASREVAYLAGMLQNLGEVLVAHHSPMHHVAIQRRVNAGTAREAASTTEIGFTFDELAMVVGRHWKLSPGVRSVWDPNATPSGLTLLARFANELTRVMSLGGRARTEAGLARLLMRYGPALRLTEDGMADTWDRALTETEDTFTNMGVSMDSHTLPTASRQQAS
jgi:hypothetical protein